MKENYKLQAAEIILKSGVAEEKCREREITGSEYEKQQQANSIKANEVYNKGKGK